MAEHGTLGAASSGPTGGGESEPILCPLLGSLAEAGRVCPHASGEVRLTRLTAALRGVPIAWTLTLPVVFFAIFSNRLRDVPRNLFRLSFNARRMRGGLLQHGADTGVLRHGALDRKALATILARSSDGVTLSLAEIGEVIALDDWRSPSKLGRVLSMLELGGVAVLFGVPGGDGEPRLPLVALREIYEERMSFDPPPPKLRMIPTMRTVWKLERYRRRAFRTVRAGGAQRDR